MSIFDGTDEIINRHLSDQCALEFEQMSALQQLAKCGLGHLDAASLIGELYEHTVDRWRESNGRFPRRASAENWRFTLNTKISERNLSAEKQVEKRIATLAEQGRLPKLNWANQIPVASGLLDQYADKKACVDLGERTEPANFDLIELKLDVGSGHALFATLEALRYGVLYLFSRRYGRELGYASGGSGLLGAKRLRLVVLAPASYYSRVPVALLQSLRDKVTLGLKAECCRDKLTDFTMDFEFEQFAEPFRWPCTDEELIESTQRRQSIFEPRCQTTQS